MKYCEHCGERIRDDADVCVYCGCKVKSANNDSKSFGWAFLCFLSPILGLILYLIWKDDRPLRAKSCGKGAVVSVIIEIVILVLYFVFIDAFL